MARTSGDSDHPSYLRVPAAIRAQRPDLYLLLPDEIERSNIPTAAQAYLEQFKVLVQWLRVFLNAPNANLGLDEEREVCPFVGPSMAKHRLWLTAQPDASPDPLEAYATMLLARDIFLEMAPKAGSRAQLKSILVMFPDIPLSAAPQIIDGTQKVLKPQFVTKGLMIGQFHELSEEPGLHNPEFRPLRSPVPLLAIRNMVPGDFLFLKDNPEFVQAYIDVFGHDIPPFLKRDVQQAAERFGVAITTQRSREK